MRLERLEIAGFKSFSDRSELACDEGVPAIVGPNGCGKSNVADAITWVLGEQSAKSLRGDKMEDVIFSGSDGRKPGAAAEVRLRLTGLPLAPSRVEGLPPTNGNGNGDGNGNGHHPSTSLGTRASFQEIVEAFTRDVEVTRRLYRSGESEYLIDGEVCRLRDVHELLMDTGLGAKAYAIIEQGKIGMILSSRPTDRRQLIEEAAGITKYKSRRRAADLKLEAAQQNLTRVDDIVFEVEKQRGTLKRQAAKARRYRGLRDELRRWEKVLFARRYRELARGIETARASLAAARERETAAAARVAEVEAHLARLRIEQAEADRHAASVRERAHAAELDINRRQQQLEFDRRHAASLGTRTTEIADEIRSLEARREPARLAIEAREQACAEAERARDEAAAVLADASESLARAQQRIDVSEAAVDAARTHAYAILNSLTTLRHAMEHAAAQRGRVGETLAKLDVEEADVFVEVQKVEADRIAASDALRRAHEALDAVRARQAEQETALTAARGEHEGSTRRVRSGEQDLAGVEARLASLEELVSTRGEFGDAARMVLVEANGHVGQQGAVADYLEVDKRYERAVEACLGDLLQHVIVERHDQAAAGLALVREHDAGRCGFVVIDPGSNGHHAREALRLPGVVPVSDVLRIAGPHATTIQNVIPEAYVAETFEQAVAVSRETTAPVATIGGDVFRGPHPVSGGARAEARGRRRSLGGAARPGCREGSGRRAERQGRGGARRARGAARARGGAGRRDRTPARSRARARGADRDAFGRARADAGAPRGAAAVDRHRRADARRRDPRARGDARPAAPGGRGRGRPPRGRGRAGYDHPGSPPAARGDSRRGRQPPHRARDPGIRPRSPRAIVRRHRADAARRGPRRRRGDGAGGGDDAGRRGNPGRRTGRRQRRTCEPRTCEP